MNSQKRDACDRVAPQQRTLLLLPQLLEEILSEKKLQYCAYPDLSITQKIAPEAAFLFLSLDRVSFQSAFSNILDNAAEAMDARGKIEVSLKKRGDQAIITIKDHGKGMTPDQLRRVGGEKGVSFGKPSGNGLGLYYAKQSIESFGGSLQIDSELHIGTTVTISLPTMKKPSWYLSEIAIPKGGRVVLLDDDPLMHQMWKLTFEDRFGTAAHIIPFHRSDQLIQWHQNRPNPNDDILYLLDYQLSADDPMNGIEVARRLDIGQQAVLVTGHFDDPEVQSLCEQFSIRLFPKSASHAICLVEEYL